MAHQLLMKLFERRVEIVRKGRTGGLKANRGKESDGWGSSFWTSQEFCRDRVQMPHPFLRGQAVGCVGEDWDQI